MIVAVAGCSGGAKNSGGGPKLKIADVLPIAYAAGFHTEAQLTAVVSIGIAESSLRVHARKWHPEYGYRPKSAVIGVQGPENVWNSTHTQQLNSDRGLWQISSHWWPQYSDAQTDDPAQAAAIMWTISKHGTDFSPWDTYKSGAAQRYRLTATDGWDAVLPQVRAFLQTK